MELEFVVIGTWSDGADVTTEIMAEGFATRAAARAYSRQMAINAPDVAFLALERAEAEGDLAAAAAVQAG